MVIDVSVLKDEGITIKRIANGYILLPSRGIPGIDPAENKEVFVFEDVFDLSQAVVRWAEYKTSKSKKDKK